MLVKGNSHGMQECFTITDAQQLKALSHAARVRILNVLTEKPMTAKQLADRFHEEPAKTSYHVKQLLKVGLVELKYTRETQNGIIEKYYQAVAKEFRTDPYLARETGAQLGSDSDFARELTLIQAEFLRAYRADLDRSREAAGTPTTAYGLYPIGVDEAELPQFLAELRALAQRYQRPDSTYHLQFLVYPQKRQDLA